MDIIHLLALLYVLVTLPLIVLGGLAVVLLWATLFGKRDDDRS